MLYMTLSPGGGLFHKRHHTFDKGMYCEIKQRHVFELKADTVAI